MFVFLRSIESDFFYWVTIWFLFFCHHPCFVALVFRRIWFPPSISKPLSILTCIKQIGTWPEKYAVSYQFFDRITAWSYAQKHDSLWTNKVYLQLSCQSGFFRVWSYFSVYSLDKYDHAKCACIQRKFEGEGLTSL